MGRNIWEQKSRGELTKVQTSVSYSASDSA